MRPIIALWMYRNENGDVVQDKLKKALEERNIKVINDFDMRECFYLNGHIFTKNGYDLSTVDILYHMNADEQTEYQNDILKALELSGVRIVNCWDAFCNAKDKFMANVILRKHGINVPPAMFVNKKQALDMAADIFNKWNAICVKLRKNHGGKGIVRFNCETDFTDFIGITQFDSYYIEKFIDFGAHDYRVEILKNEVIGSYCRVKRHPFKTNMNAGGLFTAKVPGSEFEKIALNAAKALNIETTIVDMVKSQIDGEIYILEINPIMGLFIEAFLLDSPQFKGEDVNLKHQNDELKLNRLTDYLAYIVKNEQNL